MEDYKLRDLRASHTLIIIYLAYTGRVYPEEYDIYFLKIQLFIHPSSEIAKIHGKRKKYLYHYQKVLYQHQNFSEIVLFFSEVGTPYTILPPFF